MAMALNFSEVERVLNSQVAVRAFPGATAIVADHTGLLYAAAVGRHTYEPTSMNMSLSTPFDVASLTKVRSEP